MAAHFLLSDRDHLSSVALSFPVLPKSDGND